VGSLISNKNCYKCFNSTATLLRPSERSNVELLPSITIGYIATIKGSKDPILWKSIRILLDSGCAATLFNQNLVKTLNTTKENRTKWTTKAGNFSTHRKCEVTFTSPALHKHRQITWNCYVDESNDKSISYDLIIGRDLIHEIGIDIFFRAAEVRWDDASLPMKLVDKSCPMFTVAKPGKALRSLADLRELNKRIKRKPFPIPKINDLLQILEGFYLATSLDLNMGYYHIGLTPHTSTLLYYPGMNTNI
jgi:hypothetical protein